MRWHPIPPAEERDQPVSAEEIAAKLATAALLGASAYVLHRQGELGGAVARVLDAIFNPTQSPPLGVPPPTPPPPRNRATKKRTPKRRARRAVPPPPPPPAAPSAEEEAARAAQLLGVSLAATEDEIRAAFRRVVTARLREGRGFGDQAQTSEDRAATLLLTNAKNRLVERARSQGRAP